MKESALRLESLPFSRKTCFAPAASVAGMETQPSVYHDPENLPEFRPNPVSAPGASFKLSINCGKLPGFLPANALAGQALTESPAAERPRECRDAFRGCSRLAPQNHRTSRVCQSVGGTKSGGGQSQGGQSQGGQLPQRRDGVFASIAAAGSAVACVASWGERGM